MKEDTQLELFRCLLEIVFRDRAWAQDSLPGMIGKLKESG